MGYSVDDCGFTQGMVVGYSVDDCSTHKWVAVS